MRTPALRLASFALLLVAAGCTAPLAHEPPADESDAAIAISPRSASPGVPRAIELRADGATWVPGDLEVDFGPGIAVSVLEVRSSFRAVAQILVADDAALGARDVEVRWAGGRRILRDALVVETGSLAMTPGRASLGDTLIVDVLGWDTDFSAATTVSLGDLDVRSVEVLSRSHLRATVVVPDRAAPGPRDLAVFEPPISWLSLADALFIDRDQQVMAITPDSAEQRQTLEARIFVQGGGLTADAEPDLGTGVVIEAFEILGPDWLQARLRIGNNAIPGARDVVVRSPQGDRVLPDGFTIEAVPADPSKARASITLAIVRTWLEDSCSWRRTIYATARFYEAHDFPCPSLASTSTLMPPPQFDFASTGFVASSGGSSDCPPTRTFNAGPWVRLDAEASSLLLPRVQTQYTDEVSYRLDGLSLADYAFDASYGLIAPGAEPGVGAPLPALDIPEVMHTLRRDVALSDPDFCGLMHPLDEPLTARWEPGATYDVATLYLYLMGAAAEEGTPVAMIYPWDDGRFDVMPETLEVFPPGPASLLQAAFRQTRFDVPGSSVANAGFANSIAQSRGTFLLVE